MERISIYNIEGVTELFNELEYEQASSLYLKLRTLEKGDKNYQQIRKHLKRLILNYERDHWSDESQITDEQVKENDLAEFLAEAENEFYQRRKKLIKLQLKNAGLNQNDLARILNHRKSYMSELINGLRPFSKEDIIVLNRLFKIKLEDLIPTFINREKALHIKQILISLKKNIKLPDQNFDLRLP